MLRVLNDIASFYPIFADGRIQQCNIGSSASTHDRASFIRILRDQSLPYHDVSSQKESNPLGQAHLTPQSLAQARFPTPRQFPVHLLCLGSLVKFHRQLSPSTTTLVKTNLGPVLFPLSSQPFLKPLSLFSFSHSTPTPKCLPNSPSPFPSPSPNHCLPSPHQPSF